MIFDEKMTSAKPYFIQALHQWITDNGMTPLVVADIRHEGMRVPEGYDDEGQITLNVSWDATEHLNMDSELMTFNARFGGRSQALIIPMKAINAIFARENGKGMVFDSESPSGPSPDDHDDPEPPKKGKPTLKLV